MMGLGPQAAVAGNAAEQAQVFAACAGRYTAVVDHERMSGQTAEEARARRDLFAQLLEAVEPDAHAQGLGPHGLNDYWMSARRAQERLLVVADYHVDPRRADLAALQLRQQMRLCEAIILG